ncbi:hypothetical protein NC652_038383 [Populus alba x Populus x berolinensis]|nr:hypothetical protein NC652_038383 [Populus alba x Populus x berolinensis]
MMKKVLADDELILYQPITGDLVHELNREKCLFREGNSKLAGGEDARISMFLLQLPSQVCSNYIGTYPTTKHEKIH